MPLVHIKSAHLAKDQKQRIGDRIIDAFHGEGVPPSSVVVLFGREEEDILLEGGLLFEVDSPVLEAVAPKPASLPPPPPSLPPPAPAVDKEPLPDFKNKLRRSKLELVALKAQLIKALQLQGALSSFQAQEELGLKNCDWAPATLRRFFSELEAEGVILKQGQKRGTRYVWKGMSSQPVVVVPVPRLVKRAEDEVGAN